MHNEPVSQSEIDAYIDSELDLGRRLAVETHLSRHPEQAARMMNDLRVRTALRLAQPDVDGDSALAELEHRLSTVTSVEAKTTSGIWGHRRLIFAAAGVLATIGVVSLTPRNAEAKPPAYIADAVMAFHTSVIRASMVSQHESRIFDRGDVQRSTRIRIPTLPDGWQVTDVQLFPSDEGPALQIMVQTSAGRIVSIFAVRSSQSAPAKPVSIRHGDATVAYWRNGDMAYALTGMGSPEVLDLAAEDIADNRLD